MKRIICIQCLRELPHCDGFFLTYGEAGLATIESVGASDDFHAPCSVLGFANYALEQIDDDYGEPVFSAFKLSERAIERRKEIISTLFDEGASIVYHDGRRFEVDFENKGSVFALLIDGQPESVADWIGMK
jgi:hypothetical protein